MRGQLLVMAIMGVMAGVGFWIIGLPNPVLLGVLAGLGELIPMVGPLIGFAPAVLVALGVDPWTALIVIGYAIVVQQIEGNFLVPRIMGHSVGVSPLTVVLGHPDRRDPVRPAGGVPGRADRRRDPGDRGARGRDGGRRARRPPTGPAVAREAAAQAAAGAAASAPAGEEAEAAREAVAEALDGSTADPTARRPGRRARRARRPARRDYRVAS